MKEDIRPFGKGRLGKKMFIKLHKLGEKGEKKLVEFFLPSQGVEFDEKVVKELIAFLTDFLEEE